MQMLFARGYELIGPAKSGNRKAKQELGKVLDAIEAELDEVIARRWPGKGLARW